MRRPPDPTAAHVQTEPHPDDVMQKPKSNQHSPANPGGLPRHAKWWPVPLRKRWGPEWGGGRKGEAAFTPRGPRSPERRAGQGSTEQPCAQNYRTPSFIPLLEVCACYFVNSNRSWGPHWLSLGDHLISESASCPSLRLEGWTQLPRARSLLLRLKSDRLPPTSVTN